MVACVTTLQLPRDRLDDFLRRVQDALAPAAAAQPGFGGITVLTDARVGKVLAVHFWENEADLLAGEAACDQLAGLVELLQQPALREVYEVGVQVELNELGAAHIRGI